MNIMEITELMKIGYRLHYAPVSGGQCLLRAAEDPIFIPVEPFLALRKQGQIEHVHTQNQGHSIFHGRVDIYVIKKRGVCNSP